MRIDGLSTGQTIGTQGTGDILGKLEAGDVIKAKILEITSGELLLKLVDGTEFKAATIADISARAGDTIELVVSSRSEGRLFMETVKNAGTTDIASELELKLQLEKLEFIPDDINMDVAVKVKASGLPASKEIIEKAVTLMQNFSQINSEKAVFLASKGIVPTEKNTMGLINLLSGRLKLGESLEILQNQLSSVLGDLDAGIDMGSDKSINAGTNKPGTASANVLSGNSTDIDIDIDNRQNSNINKAGNQLTADPAEINTIVNGQTDKSSTKSSAEINKQNLSAAAFSENTVASADVDAIDISQSNLASGKSTDEIMDPSKHAADTKSRMAASEEFLKNVKELMSKSSVSFNADKEIALREPNKESADVYTKNISKVIKDAGDLFVKLESDNLKTSIEVKKLFDSLNDKLDNLKHIITSSSIPEKNEILSRIASVAENVQLLNNVGNNTLYAQIPLNISGFRTTAELFVMKRGAQKKKVDPENAVLFISLDTHNIGTVQSIIEIKGKNVCVNMRAEEPEIIDLMKENTTALYKSLSNRGYKLVDTRYKLISDPSGLADMEKVINDEYKERHRGVDLKI